MVSRFRKWVEKEIISWTPKEKEVIPPEYEKMPKSYQSYYRLHKWIESRVGPLAASMPEFEIRAKLDNLLAEEERKHPGMVAGLRKYIQTNAYRKMLH
ncbi:MAG: hypothetical protein AB1485_03620 [Candidatus Thermoplasmatota archaeon]